MKYEGLYAVLVFSIHAAVICIPAGWLVARRRDAFNWTVIFCAPLLAVVGTFFTFPVIYSVGALFTSDPGDGVLRGLVVALFFVPASFVFQVIPAMLTCYFGQYLHLGPRVLDD